MSPQRSTPEIAALHSMVAACPTETTPLGTRLHRPKRQTRTSRRPLEVLRFVCYFIVAAVLTATTYSNDTAVAQKVDVKDRNGVSVLTISNIKMFRGSAPFFEAIVKTVSRADLYTINGTVHKKDGSVVQFAFDLCDWRPCVFHTDQKVTYKFSKPWPFSARDFVFVEFSLPSSLGNTSFSGDTTLSDDEILKAIALGKQYKNEDTLWQHEFQKVDTFKLPSSGYLSRSGWKFISLVTDYALVAMASAVAAHEMREFGVAEARRLPFIGKIKAVAIIYGFGAANFAFSRTHMVLEHNDKIIQPEAKAQNVTGGFYAGSQFWHIMQAGNAPLLVTPTAGTVVYAFVYDLKGDWAGNFKFILWGEDNKQYTVDVDLATLR